LSTKVTTFGGFMDVRRLPLLPLSLGLLLVACSDASDANGGPPAAPCRGADAACVGKLEVPLDRTQPSRGTIEVGYRFEPARNARTAETIAYLEGGPGIGGTSSAADIRQILGPALDDNNLLIMDYRGVGTSTPFTCPTLRDPGTPNIKERPNAEELASCAASLSPLGPEHFGTAAAADDLEDVRVALGLAPLRVFGVSYGVVAAETFAARHPTSLRSVALHAGPLPSDPRSILELDLRLIEMVNRGMEIACERQGCALRGRVSDAWATAVRAIRAGAIEGLTIEDAVFMHRAAQSGFVTDMLDAVEAYAVRSDAAPLVALGLEYRAIFRETPEPPPSALGFDNSNALFLHVYCNDLQSTVRDVRGAPARRAAYEASIAAIPDATFAPFTRDEWLAVNPPLDALCIDWPLGVALTVPRSPVAITAPILFVAPELDEASTDAARVRTNYPSAQVLAIPLGGHPGVWESTCARDELRRFLSSGAIQTSTCERDPLMTQGF
jgi:pimeloyl-ACP methyl ester carboxylesterase